MDFPHDDGAKGENSPLIHDEDEYDDVRYHHAENGEDEDELDYGYSINTLKQSIATSKHPSERDKKGGISNVVHVPYLPWFRMQTYSKKNFFRDMLAGAIVSIIAIPQGLAYSVLSSLPPVMGLYTSAVPPLIYSAFGTSSVLSIGPVAIISMFIPSIAITIHMNHDPDLRIAVACLASIVSGALLMIMGIFRLGGLVKFISSPVLNGFTSAASVVIGINQFQHILGFHLPDEEYNINTFSYLVKNATTQANPRTLLVGLGTLMLLLPLRFFSRRHPKNKILRITMNLSALLAVALGTLVSWAFTKQGYFLPIVGFVPPELPEFEVPRTAYRDLPQFGNLVGATLPVTLLAFMSSWSLARKYDSTISTSRSSGKPQQQSGGLSRPQPLNANQECWALGISNFVSGFFGCFPASGSFGRTSLNQQNGSKSALSNLWAGLVVLFVLGFLTPYLYYIPLASLGAIIQTSLISLFDFKPFKKAYRISKPDFFVMCMTFFFTAFVNIEVGLIVGILVSLCVLLQELSEIRTTVMVPVPHGGRFVVRSQSVDPDAFAPESSHIKVVRLTASLFFGSSDEVRDALQSIVELNQKQHIKAVVVDASGVSHLDLSAFEVLEQAYNMAQAKGIRLVFANAKGIFRQRLKSSKLWPKVCGEKYEYLSVDEIVTLLLHELGLYNDTSPLDLPQRGKNGKQKDYHSYEPIMTSSEEAVTIVPSFRHEE